jgi:hypothetical protein
MGSCHFPMDPPGVRAYCSLPVSRIHDSILRLYQLPYSVGRALCNERRKWLSPCRLDYEQRNRRNPRTRILLHRREYLRKTAPETTPAKVPLAPKCERLRSPGDFEIPTRRHRSN